MEKLQLYASTTYKNRADVWRSLKQDKLTTFTPQLDENATPTQNEIQKIPANNTIKREELLDANLEAMYKLVMSIWPHTQRSSV